MRRPVFDPARSAEAALLPDRGRDLHHRLVGVELALARMQLVVTRGGLRIAHALDDEQAPIPVPVEIGDPARTGKTAAIGFRRIDGLHRGGRVVGAEERVRRLRRGRLPEQRQRTGQDDRQTLDGIHVCRSLVRR